jgi:hypothetical protein
MDVFQISDWLSSKGSSTTLRRGCEYRGPPFLFGNIERDAGRDQTTFISLQPSLSFLAS